MNNKKHYNSKRATNAVPKRAAFGVPKIPRHRTLFVLSGLLLCISTLAFSSVTGDISNTVRFSCMAFILMAGCLLTIYNKYIPITFGLSIFVLFVLLQFASILWSINKAEALFEASKWLIVLFAVIQSYNLFRQHPARAVIMLVYVSAIVCLISLVVAITQADHIDSLSHTDRYAIVSFFTHKGTYSMMMLLTMVFPIMALRLHWKKKRVLSIAIIVLQTGMLVFLQARAAWMAGIASAIMLVFLRLFRNLKLKKTWQIVGSFVLALTMALSLVGGSRWFAEKQLPGPDQRGGLQSNVSVYERQSLWRMTFRMVDDKPLLGCGSGNWKVCYPKVSVRDVFSMDMLDYQFVRPHNDYLRVLSETGWLGFSFLILSLASLFVCAVSGSGRSHSRIIAETGVAFLTGAMVFAVFDFPIDRMELFFWISIICGAVMSTSHHEIQVKSHTIGNFCSCLLMAIVLFIGIIHWRSESYYPDIMHNLHHKNWNAVERLSQKARTPFCNLTPMAIPYAYYEGMAQECLKKDALESFRKALNDSPYHKKTLTDLGRLEYVINHDVKKATKYLEEAIRISPGYAYAYFNLAQIYLLENQKEKAKEVLLRIDFDHKQQQMVKMAWQYYQGDVANYYVNDVVSAEKNFRDRMLLQTQ